jgi:hypothetical protein
LSAAVLFFVAFGFTLLVLAVAVAYDLRVARRDMRAWEDFLAEHPFVDGE